ncbi:MULTISPECIES: helix-turn-helix domain-containing protein [Thalassospira]|uniref:helix-turn-helix domain-containing protein n=1 Tax=Thalassospira TaxID=168934 RepID=UPI000A1E140D|nr:helix-turn-helix domain-containing protein [Thalassospira alkalitolerans]
MAHRADKRPEEIQYLLRGKGLTFADVARKCGLPESTPRTATRKPSIEGEWAIAYFLELPASAIWPSRYDSKTGERLKPQPAANYTDFPRLGHCQKDIAA